MIGKGTLRIRAAAFAFLPPRKGYLVMDAKSLSVKARRPKLMTYAN